MFGQSSELIIRWCGVRLSGGPPDMVGSIGMRLGLINPGDWSDGLERKGSNPLPTTNLNAQMAERPNARVCKTLKPPVRIWLCAPVVKKQQIKKQLTLVPIPV